MAISPDVLSQCLLEDLAYPKEDLHLPVEWAETPQHAASRSIFQSLFKKLEGSCGDMGDSAALLKFLEANFRSKNWKLSLNTSVDEMLIGELKRSLYQFFIKDGDPIVGTDPAEIFSKGRCGPGASVGSKDSTFYNKMFSSKLATTSSFLYSSYRRSLSYFPVWGSAEMIRGATFGEFEVVDGSRLSFVPKTDKISRCICIEPSLNMYYQLGLGQILSDRLVEYFNIDISTQQFRNRDMARIGSINDNLVTIDLSSASDSVGLNLCQEILPKELLSILKLLRSKSTNIPGLGSFELDIISSMGNGFTFPLQTMIFAAMVESAYRVAGEVLPRSFKQTEWGVFGDDIIVPKGKISRLLLRLLDLCGFICNSSKTFLEGPFRESCGVDFFLGVDVRGVYFRRLVTKQDVFVAINRCNQFSARTGITLKTLVSKLMEFVPKCFVPMHENDDSGIKAPLAIARSFSEFRYYTDRNGSVCYTAYRPITRAIRFFDRYMNIPKLARAKGYILNEPGAWLCFLQRSLASCAITLRLERVSYRKVKLVSPCWDTSQPTHRLSRWFPLRSPEDSVYFNIC